MPHKLRMVSIGALASLFVTALPAQSPLSLQSDGIQFPDGTVQTTADPRRSFYLTDSTVTAIGAPFLCDTGYHFASIWEILDVSNLQYAVEHPNAHTAPDSGEGPVSQKFGWVRTGHASVTTGPKGYANCSAWTVLDGLGTVVLLSNAWEGIGGPDVDWLGPWFPSTATCNVPQRVWCMQD